jgi:hypothetical protein
LRVRQSSPAIAKTDDLDDLGLSFSETSVAILHGSGGEAALWQSDRDSTLV